MHTKIAEPPSWACNQWGQYEHDWLDCPDCLEHYEKFLETPEEPPMHKKTTQGHAFVVTVPEALNIADMNEHGKRSGPLSVYGNPYDSTSVDRALNAWDVKATFLLNPTHQNKAPTITNASGPRYMLLFADGLWRYASFGGLNGPPWFYVEFTGYPGETGEIADLCRMIDLKRSQYTDAKEAFLRTERELLELHDKMQELKEQQLTKRK